MYSINIIYCDIRNRKQHDMLIINLQKSIEVCSLVDIRFENIHLILILCLIFNVWNQMMYQKPQPENIKRLSRAATVYIHLKNYINYYYKFTKYKKKYLLEFLSVGNKIKINYYCFDSTLVSSGNGNVVFRSKSRKPHNNYTEKKVDIQCGGNTR